MAAIWWWLRLAWGLATRRDVRHDARGWLRAWRRQTRRRRWRVDPRVSWTAGAVSMAADAAPNRWADADPHVTAWRGTNADRFPGPSPDEIAKDWAGTVADYEASAAEQRMFDAEARKQRAAFLGKRYRDAHVEKTEGLDD